MVMEEFHLPLKFVIATSILVFWSGFWFVHFIAIIYGYRKLHRRRTLNIDSESGVMGVSILKPLVGCPMDPNLMTNLESFFTMSYPKFELLFCVQEESDPSIMIVEQLRKKHPHVDSSLFVGGNCVGVNPKINNMNPGYNKAKHELVLVSDSGLLMKEDTLADMVSYMTSNIGIVHQMPYTCDRKGWPSILEKQHLAYWMVLISLNRQWALNFTFLTFYKCIFSWKCEKLKLFTLIGLSAFGAYLAEDYFFAKCFQDKGWGIRISSQPAWQNSGIIQVKGFLGRLTRWCKLRVSMVPHTLVLEPITECVLLGLIGSWAGMVLLRADFLTFFLFHTLAWLFFDWIMLNIVQNGSPPFSKFEFILSWVFREVSALFLYMHAVFNPVIKWRTGYYRLKWWGIAEPINMSKRISVM
ncbi:Ceramide glucosyltransferase [Armadillidium vulgare]|nr:Ceramide glucosyltransferase [Armadillidium vulgare]